MNIHVADVVGQSVSASEAMEDVVLLLKMMVDSLLYTRDLVEAGKPTAEILTAIDSVTTNLRTAGEAATPKPGSAEMKTYHVTVSREMTQTHVLEVEAEDEDAAREQAESEIDNIADGDWDDGVADSDPEIDKVQEVADDGEEVEADDDTATLNIVTE